MADRGRRVRDAAVEQASAAPTRAGADAGRTLARRRSAELNEAANRHLWDGHWFARGITDDGLAFGVSS